MDKGNLARGASLNVLLVVVGLLMLSFSARAGEKIYKVKKNDTLIAIAREHGLTVDRLAAYNRIKEPNDIFVGQKLAIPPKYELPAQIQEVLAQTAIESKKWKYIVIHHSATGNGNARSLDRYHREERHMENGLAYHFLIGNSHGMGDGEIAIGRRWTEQLDGGHLASETLNQESIGICLVGNFEKDRPTEKQMKNLLALIDYLLTRCGLPTGAVQTHQKINTIHTRCPGRRFPAQNFFSQVKRLRVSPL